MANSLNRDLKIGDKIVLRGGVTAVIKTNSFGCSSFTRGTALFVSLDGGPTERTDGYRIDAKATIEKFGKENGWAA